MGTLQMRWYSQNLWAKCTFCLVLIFWHLMNHIQFCCYYNLKYCWKVCCIVNWVCIVTKLERHSKSEPLLIWRVGRAFEIWNKLSRGTSNEFAGLPIWTAPFYTGSGDGHSQTCLSLSVRVLNTGDRTSWYCCTRHWSNVYSPGRTAVRNWKGCKKG